MEMLTNGNLGAMAIPEAISALRANQNGDTVTLGGNSLGGS